MNESKVQCPVCLNAHGGECIKIALASIDAAKYQCDICGQFQLDGLTLLTRLGADNQEFDQVQRAAITHRIRNLNDEAGQIPALDSDWLGEFKDHAALPTPATQMLNLIRYVGWYVHKNGAHLKQLPIELYAVIGAPNPERVAELAVELKAEGILKGVDVSNLQDKGLIDVDLTTRGWKEYQMEYEGKKSGGYFFIALQFHDEILDPLIKTYIKPVIEKELGFKAQDMRDVARAGIIDEIMRQQIRDSTLVIADLTHDNANVYWEAGFAEGLKKPVIYICEESKFNRKDRYFDTSHCTTVTWKADAPEDFSARLLETIKRSLQLEVK
ncbi:hypothetical protein [Limibacillus halophilus]|uniref:Nucleoside 2-deoxyribosyltransferase n=1 Tax=Limibacillus halophilus TaxID=1579333 RepID=A0A839SYA5_9PROT|nr:hypothetical protein [Limibacillus halophilus]MBB3066604.1 hypothetical protein [Limibacillus halophilus]